MADDEYIASAHRVGQQLFAARKRTEAQLEEYRADGNQEGIDESMLDLSKIRAQGNALNQEYNEHVQRNYQPIQQTAEEWRVKSAEKMTGDDGLAVVNYGKKPGDPTWISPQEYNEQAQVLRSKKSRGEYT